MRILAIDTSTDACSVALAVNDAITEDHRVLVRGHHRELLPMIDALLGAAGVRPRTLTGVVLSAGPGSFTGLRIGASVAQGVALAANCRIAAVSSLHVLAQGVAVDDGMAVIATQPARPGEVYAGVYRRRGNAWTVERADCTLALSNARRELDGVERAVLAGRSAAELGAVIGSALEVTGIELPHAAHALVLGTPLFASGEAVEPGHLELAYVSDTSAWRKA